MKKFFVVLAAFAALTLASCDKENKKVDPTGGVDVCSENLVAYFPLNSATDCVVTGEGVTYDALAGTAKFGVGARGGCYESTGDVNTMAYLSLKVPANFVRSLTSFTLSAWIFPNDYRGGIFTVGSVDKVVDANWGAFDLFLDGGDADSGALLKGYFYNDNTAADWHGFYPGFRAINALAWQFVTMTYDENSSKAMMFVNGSKVFEQDVLLGDGKAGAGKITMLNAANCYIGAFAQRVTGASAEEWLSYFSGKIDEVRLFNKGLSETEVAQLYRAEVAVTDGLD
ncbi:MAG: LamG domain-containing protein [Bacteroidales bacterium]|nr:LamG domain-containing protein [Bacteroidales bacterium]